MGRVSIDSMIGTSDIIEISRLSQGHPVWLVTGGQDTTVVIKTESVGEKEDMGKLKQVMSVMKVVSPMAKMKKMENSEIHAVRTWIGFAQLTDSYDDQNYVQNINELTNQLNNPMRTWIKMETVKFISLEDKDEHTAKKIGKALSATGGLEAMGAIIAADMFNGNNDRFDLSRIFIDDDPRGITWGPKKKQLQYLFNPGNIIIREDGETASVVGLDPFDNSSRIAGLISLLPKNGDEWPYKLFNPAYRNNIPGIAETIAKDLRRVIGKTSGTISRYRLKKNAGQRLAAGMLEGAKLIENYFKLKYGANTSVAPPGFAQRATVAGWTWFTGQTTFTAMGNLPRSRRFN